MKGFSWIHSARLVLAALLLIAGGLAAGESRAFPDRSIARPVITITDSNGALLSSAAPGLNSQIVDVTVGPVGADFTFEPSTVTIMVGDTVRWTWVGNNHTVTSGNSCTVDNKFCSPGDTNCNNADVSNAGAVYSHTFAQAGTFPYYCRPHCSFGMRGTVKVIAPFVTITSVTRAPNGHIIIDGKALPNVTVMIKSAPDLLTVFSDPQPINTDANGLFHYDDADGAGTPMKFFQATFP